jgi:hypothetical protein
MIKNNTVDLLLHDGKWKETLRIFLTWNTDALAMPRGNNGTVLAGEWELASWNWNLFRLVAKVRKGGLIFCWAAERPWAAKAQDKQYSFFMGCYNEMDPFLKEVPAFILTQPAGKTFPPYGVGTVGKMDIMQPMNAIMQDTGHDWQWKW